MPRMIRTRVYTAATLLVLLMTDYSAQQTRSSFASGSAANRITLQQVATVAAKRSVHDAFEWFSSHRREISDKQLELTAIPAPPFGESRRAEWVKGQFHQLGLDDVHIDSKGNVLGVRRGTNPRSKFVLLSAHLDTVFPPSTELQVFRDGEKLRGPGISDNGAGLAALLAIAGAMQATDLRSESPVLFLANVGEEGEGDLRGMRHIFAEPRWKDSIAYSVVLDGGGSDSMVTQALGSKRFLVTVNGPGGHSWSDFGTPNPVVVLARVIDRFSRTSVPVNPKTTFNIGAISGGTSVNAIPESASMKIDLRSSSPEEIDRLERALRTALSTATSEYTAHDGKKASVTYTVQVIGHRPAAELPQDSKILKVLRAVDEQLHIQSRMQRASTDANIPLSMGFEAVTLGGGGTGGGAHTVHEWYDPTNRELGLRRILLAILTLAGVPQ